MEKKQVNKKHFTANQVKELVWENEVERTEGENRRWSRTITSIIKFGGKYYSVYWEQGLTEMQENEYEDQNAPEVKQVEETITVKKWIAV